MAEVWAKVFDDLREDTSFRHMFHMIELHGNKIAAELTDKSGNEITRTYAEYTDMIRTACGNMQRMGYDDKGEVIGFIYETCMDWPVLMWGILMSGNIPLFMNPSADKELLCNIMKEAGATAYVTSAPIEGCEAKFIDAKSLLTEGAHGEEKWGHYIALCTSGTTGNSRIFLYDSQTINKQLLGFEEVCKNNAELPYVDGKPCKHLAFLPFHHIFGFMVVYLGYSLLGKTLVYMKDRSVQTILSACQNHGVTHLFCIPLFYNALANGIDKQLEGKDVKTIPWLMKYFIKRKTLGPKIRVMISGGGHIPERTLEVLNHIGYPLHNGFGMTETGIVCVESSDDKVQRIKGSIGVPFDSLEWKINSEGGDKGELMLRGDVLYSASMIDGHIVPRDKNVWFGTGDVVERKPDGLYIAGRVKDIIVNASGENIYPEELEDKFSKLSGINNYCILGICNGAYEDVTMIVEPHPNKFDKETLIPEIKRINEKLSTGEKITKVYISKDALPVSGNMKIKRQTLKRSLEDGSWPCEIMEVYASQSDKAPKVAATIVAKKIANKAAANESNAFESTDEFKEIVKTIKGITSENLGINIDSVGEKDHFVTKLGGDSLTLFGVFGAISEKYGVEITTDEMIQIENIFEAAKVVYIKLNGEANDTDGQAVAEDDKTKLQKNIEYFEKRAIEEGLVTRSIAECAVVAVDISGVTKEFVITADQKEEQLERMISEAANEKCNNQ